MDEQESGHMLTNTIRTMRALALTLAATAAVAGCGGSSVEQSKTLPAISTLPSASAVASPSPSGIDAATPQGAAAFAEFYYQEVQKAFATLDPSVLRRFSAPNCESCQNFINSVSGIRADGGRVEGYRITVTTAVAPADTGATARVDVVRDSTTAVEYDKSGNVVNRVLGHRGIEEQVNLDHVDGAWRVTGIVRIRVRG